MDTRSIRADLERGRLCAPSGDTEEEGREFQAQERDEIRGALVDQASRESATHGRGGSGGESRAALSEIRDFVNTKGKLAQRHTHIHADTWQFQLPCAKQFQMHMCPIMQTHIHSHTWQSCFYSPARPPLTLKGPW